MLKMLRIKLMPKLGPAMSITEYIEQSLADIKQLRDEIRLKLHLAGMETKTAWEEFEPKLHDTERKLKSMGEEALEEAKNTVEEAKIRCKDILMNINI